MAKTAADAATGNVEVTPKTFELTRFRMVEASFLDCNIRSTQQAMTSQADSQCFQITRLLLLPNFDMAAERVFYTIELHIQGSNENNEPTGTTGEFRLYFAFEVVSLLEYSKTAEGQDSPFPIPDLMIMLGGVAYSTMRGLLFGKTAGTPLSGFALPLRSPKDLFFESLSLIKAEATPETHKKQASTKRKPKV